MPYRITRDIKSVRLTNAINNGQKSKKWWEKLALDILTADRRKRYNLGLSPASFIIMPLTPTEELEVERGMPGWYENLGRGDSSSSMGINGPD